MSDVKKYYYLKLKSDFFESDEITILESMPDGYLFTNILLKLYLRSLKSDGKLMFNDRIPYSANMIATITRHQVGTVERALKIFSELALIEIMDSGAIYMLDIQNFIGKSSSEGVRKKAYREKIESEKLKLGQSWDKNGTMSQKKGGQCPPEIEIEKEKEIEIDSYTYQQIVDMYNETCVSYPRCTKLSDARIKSIKARLKKFSVDDFKVLFNKAENSDFLKGANKNNWRASFDWLIADKNFVKVIDGNFDDFNNYNNTGGGGNGKQIGIYL